MGWFRVAQYVVVFPTILALLSTSRQLGLSKSYRKNKSHLENYNHENFNTRTNAIHAAKSNNNFVLNAANLPPEVEYLISNDIKKRNAKVGAAIALFLLIIQNSALTIFMRMTRLKCATKTYITSTAVVMTELMKFLTCFVLFMKDDCNFNFQDMKSILYTELTENWKDLLAIFIPSSLYVLQNNLQFIAVGNLPAQVYQVLIQSKIITTALFSYVLLSKRNTALQYFSIFLLAVGVGIVQLSFPSVILSNGTIGGTNYFIGLLAVVVSCFTSGYAGVFFERIMKSKPNRLWLRNMEMSLISIIIALVGSLSKDLPAMQTKGFFYGYDKMVLFVIFLQAFGGIVVSLVVKYTNSMIKGFATSGSIILSCILSHFLFHDFPFSFKFFLGTITVVLATLGYSIPATSWEKLFKKTLYKLLRTGDNCSDSFENDKKAF